MGGWVDGASAGMPFLDFFRTLPRVLWIARAVRWPLHHSPGRRQCAWRGAGGGGFACRIITRPLFFPAPVAVAAHLSWRQQPSAQRQLLAARIRRIR